MDWRTGWARGGVVFASFWMGFLFIISILLSAREVPPALCRRPPPRVRFSWPGIGGRRERRAFARDQEPRRSSPLRASMARTHPFAADAARPKPHASEG